jgi:acyl-coenzyme A thioesterase PaaI-like protein
MDRPYADAVRNRVLSALADNRVPGFSFLGHFLQLDWPTIGADSIVQTMAAEPHCRDGEGRINIGALCGMLDIGLASAPRLKIGPSARQATVQLHLQFTGYPANGPLAMEAVFEGFSAGNALRQTFSRGVVRSDGVPVCHARGAFVALPPPRGIDLGPLPWERERSGARAPLKPGDLDPREQAVFETCNRALASCDENHAFIERFWGMMPEPTKDGACCEVAIGPVLSNRVGDVQGGLLLGLAAATAKVAAPGHPMLSTISAWFISPGRGDSLSVHSEVLHTGRSLAVVRTQVRSAKDLLVLEAVSNHAA